MIISAIFGLRCFSKAAISFVKSIEKAGTGFAFPSQTIYLQETDPPEIMAPPARSEGFERARQKIEHATRRKGYGEAEDDG